MLFSIVGELGERRSVIPERMLKQQAVLSIDIRNFFKLCIFSAKSAYIKESVPEIEIDDDIAITYLAGDLSKIEALGERLDLIEIAGRRLLQRNQNLLFVSSSSDKSDLIFGIVLYSEFKVTASSLIIRMRRCRISMKDFVICIENQGWS